MMRTINEGIYYCGGISQAPLIQELNGESTSAMNRIDVIDQDGNDILFRDLVTPIEF